MRRTRWQDGMASGGLTTAAASGGAMAAVAEEGEGKRRLARGFYGTATTRGRATRGQGGFPCRRALAATAASRHGRRGHGDSEGVKVMVTSATVAGTEICKLLPKIELHSKISKNNLGLIFQDLQLSQKKYFQILSRNLNFESNLKRE